MNTLVHQSRAPLAVWLLVTAALGAGFLGLELRDFIEMVGKGGIPTRSGWMSTNYALVGLHGSRIASGRIRIAVMEAQLVVLGLYNQVKTRFLLRGLYWHFLDLIWVGIFSMVFLVGVA